MKQKMMTEIVMKYQLNRVLLHKLAGIKIKMISENSAKNEIFSRSFDCRACG